MKFELLNTNGKARLGKLNFDRGIVNTPAFMPVGTYGTVKAMTVEEVKELGAEIILGNTFHLSITPSTDVIEAHGDLHDFMNWSGQILTDSGGFQQGHGHWHVHGLGRVHGHRQWHRDRHRHRHRHLRRHWQRHRQWPRQPCKFLGHLNIMFKNHMSGTFEKFGGTRICRINWTFQNDQGYRGVPLPMPMLTHPLHSHPYPSHLLPPPLSFFPSHPLPRLSFCLKPKIAWAQASCS